MAAQAPLPNELYATISGQIDQEAIQRIFSSFAFASQNGVQKAHALFQYTGGGIGEGIALYN